MLGVMDELPMLEVGEVHIPGRALLLTYTDGLTEVLTRCRMSSGRKASCACWSATATCR
jgi:sigma-B regulation protein RsbU (phosphoserine phosphatase)